MDPALQSPHTTHTSPRVPLHLSWATAHRNLKHLRLTTLHNQLGSARYTARPNQDPHLKTRERSTPRGNTPKRPATPLQTDSPNTDAGVTKHCACHEKRKNTHCAATRTHLVLPPLVLVLVLGAVLLVLGAVLLVHGAVLLLVLGAVTAAGKAFVTVVAEPKATTRVLASTRAGKYAKHVLGTRLKTGRPCSQLGAVLGSSLT